MRWPVPDGSAVPYFGPHATTAWMASGGGRGRRTARDGAGVRARRRRHVGLRRPAQPAPVDRQPQQLPPRGPEGGGRPAHADRPGRPAGARVPAPAAAAAVLPAGGAPDRARRVGGPERLALREPAHPLGHQRRPVRAGDAGAGHQGAAHPGHRLPHLVPHARLVPERGEDLVRRQPEPRADRDPAGAQGHADQRSTASRSPCRCRGPPSAWTPSTPRSAASSPSTGRSRRTTSAATARRSSGRS